MSTDLVIPIVGEVIDLDGPTDMLAEAYDRISQLERDLREARGEVRRVLLDRMDVENVRKHLAGDWQIECEAPGQFQYDVVALDAVLAGLVTAGKISDRARHAALEPVEVLKPRKREIDKLLKSELLDAEDHAAIRECERPLTRERRLTVKGGTA